MNLDPTRSDNFAGESHPGAANPGTSERLFSLSFTAVLVGQITAILADRLNNIALIELLSIETGRFAETRSAFELSKLALAMTLPAVLLGPLAGAYVDRVRRRRVLIVSDVVRGFVALAIPFLRPALPMWTVYGAVALLYLSGLFFIPARCAVVPEIVSRARLLKANSMLTLGATVATIVGFGAGGLVVMQAGWKAALVIDAVCYFLSAAAFALLKPTVSPPAQGHQARIPYFGAVGAAIREVRALPGARVGVVIPPLVVVAGTAAYVLGVPLIENRLEQGTLVVGLLTGLVGLGMAVGSYLTGTLLRGASREKTALVAACASVVSLALAGLTQQILLVGAAVMAAGIAAGPVFVASETAIQEQVKSYRQATTFAVRDTLMKIASAVSAVLAPAVATAVGLRPAMVLLLAAVLPLIGLSGLAGVTRRRA